MSHVARNVSTLALLAALSVTQLASSQTPAASGAPATSAAPTQEALAPPSAATTTGAPTSAQRRVSPPPAPPTAAQRAAFERLSREARKYEQHGKEYRAVLTQIVRHHYEERRRRVLAELDKELVREKKALAQARRDAIAQLEAFLAKYSGENADPQATPDTMFRLAALYEEVARDSTSGELSQDIKPAIALYRRIITEFPQYEELAAVHYYLGHALTDAGRLEEGQQAWRSLVCSNRYTVKPDPAAEGKLALQPLPQDHDDKYWNEWYNNHPIPLDQERKAAKLKPAAKPKPGQPPRRDVEELSYANPYQGCAPIQQAVPAGEEPRYLAEVWWQIGNYHFDQVDPRGGPYNLNRAVTAYEEAMKYKKEPLFGVSMYKQAWAFYKQQRYRSSVEWFVRLLLHTDEIEAKTGDPGTDFRQEAYTYIAGSLTYVDFDGPPPEDPLIPRSDVLDTESDPLMAEQKMAIAIQRVQDPAIVPQDKKWTVEIYKSLAQEFIEITHHRNAIATLELTLKRFPNDRDAPVMQNKVAELYDALSQLAPDGSEAKMDYAARALEARTKLANYVGNTPWTDANRDDPEALQTAEQLVKSGLKRAAADHTNNARRYVDQATERSDPGEQVALIDKAIVEYRLAEAGWKGYLEQDPNATDAYESRFWLADARYWVVVLQLKIGRAPSAQEIQQARASAVAVRDSNEDDKYQTNAGYYLVTIAEQLLDFEYKKHERSGGKEGLEKRDEVRFTGEGDNRVVVKEPVPPLVMDTIVARDEYVARVPAERDPRQNGLLYAFQAGDYFFVYGQFAEAERRFRPLYEAECNKSEWGYKAWKRLFDMAALTKDVGAARKLTEAKSCALTPEQKAEEGPLRQNTLDFGRYADAAALFKEAEALPEGPAKRAKWREAAAAYKVALDAAPDRDEAPEAAMNGAYAYKQVGEYDKAIAMYELFIAKYGSEKLLQGLKVGDPKAKPPVAPDPAKYEQRVGYLKGAYDALAGSYVLFFNYPKAGETFDKISSIEHFKTADRREAAKQALMLYASLGDGGGMERTRKRYRDLGASPAEMAEADFIVASSDLKRWDQYSPDTGANEAARRKAQAAMETYYNANKGKESSGRFAVQAAYWVAKMKKAASATDTNKWWRNTIEAFEAFKRWSPVKDGQNTALGSLEAGMAAEGEYTMLDAELVQKYDYESGFHRYKGDPVAVLTAYRKQATEAKKWYDKLQHVIDAYLSPEWTVAAVSRQGAVYDSLRTGLYNVRAPALVMFTPAEERLLEKLENSDNDELMEKADAFRVKKQNEWRDQRDKELAGADTILVDRYGQAIVLSRRFKVSSPAVVHAIRRLAFLTDVLGEAKMKAYASAVKDLNYTEGMFLRMRPGQTVTPPSKGDPAPLPAAAN